jgi:hypothetical protein
MKTKWLAALTLHRETGAFQAEKIYIHKGNAIFRGKEYTA